MNVRFVGWWLACQRVLFSILCLAALDSYGDLSLLCSPNVTVACDRAWSFTDPVPSSDCTNGNGYVDWQPFVTVTSGVCPKVITRTWTVTDYCGSTAVCNQAVTLLDTNPPAAICSGVNYVPNPSLESYYACPDFLGQVPLAAPWYPPSVATPDYFNTCTTNGLIGVPGNFAGSQMPLTGQAYLGAIVHRDQIGDDTTSYREYLQVPLIAPLVAGQLYTVSFHVSLAENSPTAISSIGAHLSVGPVLLPSGDYVLPVTPQVVNPSTNILNDDVNWVLIQGTYTAAGGEDHLTLGNFLNNTNTPSVLRGGTNDYTYYYFDDVAVVATCSPLVTAKVVECGMPWSFDLPKAVDPCSGTNVAISVAGTMTNSACPLELIRTWKLTDPCGNTSSWSQAVMVQETMPPVVLCECIAASAAAMLTTNSCAGVVPDLSPYNTCVEFACGEVTITQNPAAGTVYGPGNYMITTLVESCSGSISTCHVPFVVHAPEPVIIMPTNLVVQTCSNTAVVLYNVTAVGGAGPVVCNPASGSVFTQGVTTVTCVATSACGGVATNAFTVTVRPPRARWFCNLVGVGIGIPYGPVGGSSTMIRTAPGEDYPSITVFADGSDPENSSVALNPGPADSVRFGTVLDFTRPTGHGFDLVPSPDAMDPSPDPLLSIRKLGISGYGVVIGNRHMSVPSGMYTAIAVDTNGNLFNSVQYTEAEMETNQLLVIGFQPGITNCHIVVETDLRTGSVSIEFPGTITPSASRKGWDGCIYGPDRPRPKPPKTARVVLVPPVNPALPPMEEFSLRMSGWTSMVVEEPSMTVRGRKWSDGHVTLLKAYDDGSEQGVDFVAAGPEASVGIDTGYARDFSMSLVPMHGSDVVEQFQELRMVGWPPLTTTNRPPPQTNVVRISASTSGSGYDIAADFSQSGFSNAMVQLWNSGALVGEIPAHLATLENPLALLADFPVQWSSPGVGEVRLSDVTNGIVVLGGMDCGGLPCVGTELRIIAEATPDSETVLNYTGLEFHLAEGMDMRLLDLVTTPACTNIPLAASNATGGVVVSWEGDGFRLQGAESAHGPWHDLGALSPVTLSEGTPLRIFRLLCD